MRTAPTVQERKSTIKTPKSVTPVKKHSSERSEPIKDAKQKAKDSEQAQAKI